MLKTPETKARFFSVRYSVKIQGVRYIPSVCYPLSEGLRSVIEEMAGKDIAKVHTEEVRFVTGVPYPVRKPEALRSSSVSTPKPQAAAKKPGRRTAKSALAAQTNREFD
jgi:hypothetical protein